MNSATNQEQSDAYHAGYKAKVVEIDGMGWNAARDKFNADYPRDSRQCSMMAWHYSKGEMDALVERKQ